MTDQTADPEREAITLTRDLPRGHYLVFEDHPAGTWLTKAGQPSRKDRRRYLLDSEQVESVTGFVDALRKRALEVWLERESAIGAVEADRAGQLAGVLPEHWARQARQLGLGASAKKDEAADRGTIIHAALHQLATTGVAPNPADVPEIARLWMQGAIRAWLAVEAVETVEAEQPVAHVDLEYAGRPDVVVRDCDGRSVLLDWKSGNGKAYPEVHFQLRLYRMALESMGVPIDRAVALAINDQGGFELVDCMCSEREARALITVARAHRRIDQAMFAQRRISAKLSAAQADQGSVTDAENSADARAAA